MKLGLIGCGNVAYWIHLRALQRIPGATLSAVADPDPEARDRARQLVRVPVYAQADELLKQEGIGAVVICGPTLVHAELAIAAAERGKHFYLEKPIATSVAEAQRVMQVTTEAGVAGAIGFNRRLHPLYLQARDLLAHGRIGRVRAVQTAFCEPSPVDKMPLWKQRRATGGGVLLDLASHHIDQLRWFLDDEVASVAASLRSDLTEDDTAKVELATRGGVEVQSFFSFRTALADYLEFFGERGTLRVDRHSRALTLRTGRRLRYGVQTVRLLPTSALVAWRIRRLVHPSADPSYQRSLRAFVELLQGGPPRTASLTDGLRSLEAVLAAEKSAHRRDGPHSDPQRIEVPCVSC